MQRVCVCWSKTRRELSGVSLPSLLQAEQLLSEQQPLKAQHCSLELLLSVCNHLCHPSPMPLLQALSAKPPQDAHTVSTGPGASLQQAVQETPATPSCMPAWG